MDAPGNEGEHGGKGLELEIQAGNDKKPGVCSAAEMSWEPSLASQWGELWLLLISSVN